MYTVSHRLEYTLPTHLVCHNVSMLLISQKASKLLGDLPYATMTYSITQSCMPTKYSLKLNWGLQPKESYRKPRSCALFVESRVQRVRTFGLIFGPRRRHSIRRKDNKAILRPLCSLRLQVHGIVFSSTYYGGVSTILVAQISNSPGQGFIYTEQFIGDTVSVYM
ncbi:hypothetical protein ABKN59_002110 [Abortiporus biennis]